MDKLDIFCSKTFLIQMRPVNKGTISCHYDKVNVLTTLIDKRLFQIQGMGHLSCGLYTHQNV